MATPKKHEDRRIQRTRQVLRQAFIEVMLEKGFAATSIQDITERANVNRGTFYLHFADKYELLDTIIREEFHRQVSMLPPASRWDRETLLLLIQTMLDSFEKKYRHQPASLLVPVPLLERAMHEELTELLLTWLKQARHKETGATRGRVPLETMARVVSWAIFGTAVQWSQEETTMSSEQMAHAILFVILEGVARLTPNALPE